MPTMFGLSVSGLCHLPASGLRTPLGFLLFRLPFAVCFYCSAGDEFRRVAPFSLPDYSCQIAYTSGNAIQNIRYSSITQSLTS
jgi:hypothetical protein